MKRNYKYANIGNLSSSVFCDTKLPLNNSNIYKQPMMGPLESLYPLDNWYFAKDAVANYTKKYEPIGYLCFLENTRGVIVMQSIDASYQYTNNFYMKCVLFHNNIDGKIVTCIIGRGHVTTFKGYVAGIQMDGSTISNNKAFIGKVALAAGLITDLKSVNYGSKISNQQRVVLEFLYIDSMLEAYVDGQYIGKVLDKSASDFSSGIYSYIIGSNDHNDLSTTDTEVIIEDFQIIFI